MFFSGIFSTHIPYVILAILYSIGFGTYSINYICNKLPGKKESEKEIKFVQNKALDNTCFQFQEYRLSKQGHYNCCLTKSSKANLRPFFKRRKYIILDNIKIFGLNDDFVLFSRPPPCIYSSIHETINNKV